MSSFMLILFNSLRRKQVSLLFLTLLEIKRLEYFQFYINFIHRNPISFFLSFFFLYLFLLIELFFLVQLIFMERWKQQISLTSSVYKINLWNNILQTNHRHLYIRIRVRSYLLSVPKNILYNQEVISLHRNDLPFSNFDDLYIMHELSTNILVFRYLLKNITVLEECLYSPARYWNKIKGAERPGYSELCTIDSSIRSSK